MAVGHDVITYMSFFFVDIVGLSDPLLSTSTQANKIKVLNRMVADCPTFASTGSDDMIILPTGDGMAIGFKKGLEKPVLLAKELHLKLNEYNRDDSGHEKVSIRIGCHDGHIFFVHDIVGNLNFWGPGIILARRVMDLGDAGHILITPSMAEGLMALSNEYRELIHPIHDYEIKHGQTVLIYSIYGPNFGNSARPKREVPIPTAGVLSKISSLAENIVEGFLYNKIELRYILIDIESHLILRRRTCHIKNNASEPIFVLNEILTNVEQSVSEIKLRLYDELDEEFKITAIVSDGIEKIFIAKFNQPIVPGQANRLYTIAYETRQKERRLYETLMVACPEVIVTFEYPVDIVADPRLIHVRDNDEFPVERGMMVRSSSRYIFRWTKMHTTKKGDAVKLEW